jgi:hypothetical protein
MQTRLDYVPPHRQPKSLISRYFEFLMHYTYRYPGLMSAIVKITGVASVVLMASPLVSNTGLLTFAAGAFGAAAAATSYVAQHLVFGFPLDMNDSPYTTTEELSHNNQNATGRIIVEEGRLPLLTIKSTNHYDAGYVEGYLLAPVIRGMLRNMQGMFRVLGLFFGEPDKNRALSQNLNDLLQQIPDEYRDEVTGKLMGYNTWLATNHPQEKPLTLEKYLIMQLLPDLRNYNPFPNVSLREQMFDKLRDYMPGMSCTSIMLKLNNQIIGTRVLDWPSQGMSKYVLQIERSIVGNKTFTDVTVPTVTGCLTAFSDNLCVHMNVAKGPVGAGMPAILFNRYCIERANSIADIHELLKSHQPLGAYHMTVVGESAVSFHFYLSKDKYKEHVCENIGEDNTELQLLVVSNKGVKLVNDAIVDDNHRDSNERISNLAGFFSHQAVNARLGVYLAKLRGGNQLDPAELMGVMNIGLESARLPLVNNNESVLCAQFHVENGQVKSASAVYNNLYAQSSDREAFKKVTLPGI